MKNIISKAKSKSNTLSPKKVFDIDEFVIDSLNDFLININENSKGYSKSSIVYVDNELHQALCKIKMLISSSNEIREKLIISNLVTNLLEAFIIEFKDDLKKISNKKANKFIDF